ncbi:hypothetical protein REJC140_01681 [Pseudorhizobium endolithicum]|uniref:Uncharacterized protein n=1 Tax=Pseudorhizobium endolithicum TaxID=1191678 RepID=A0ABN7JXH8_9HYPH|nr:hypothetical protein [Pseudorhizobium endolithicum]CAD6409495.1 hypothetical protein REQ54_00583 [Rhizobium sp. Q54]CAD7050762.1 hypothetical protein REJC140_01681 [Pseudorhizobium endolithicum]
MGEDRNAQEAVEQRQREAADKAGQPEGPHAQERLTDREKTPGSGALPDDSTREADVGPD